MSTYRFIGIDHLIADLRLNEYGQAVELPDDVARIAVLGRCPLLPDAEFQACGLTPEELELYRHPGPRDSAPESTQAKFLSARMALHKYRESLSQVQSLAALVPLKEA